MPNEIPITRDRWLNDRKRDRLAAQVEHYNIRAGEDATELALLRAENERLREALEAAAKRFQRENLLDEAAYLREMAREVKL